MNKRGDRTGQPPRPRWGARWVRLGPLGRDLTVVLAVKIVALALLWWAFFSHPVTRHMQIASPTVAAHLVPAASPEHPPHAYR